jgi:predicted ArsR family transcriptional regulator
MRTRDKLERYIKSIKTPLHVDQLAIRFLVSTTTIRKILKEMEHEGKAGYRIVKGKKLWTYRHTAYVAVPNKPRVFTTTHKPTPTRRQTHL